MPVMTIASMPHGLATIWARWVTRVLVVVKVHPEVAGFAAASASWSTGPRGFWGDNRGTMVRRGLGWWPSVGWLGLSPLAHGVGAF